MFTQLPQEVRLEIISYLVPSGRVLRLIGDSTRSQLAAISRELPYYLQVNRDFANDVLTTLFTNNKTFVTGSAVGFRGLVQRAGPHIARLIRHVVYDGALGFTRFRHSPELAAEIVRELSDLVRWLPNLQTLHLPGCGRGKYDYRTFTFSDAIWTERNLNLLIGVVNASPTLRGARVYVTSKCDGEYGHADCVTTVFKTQSSQHQLTSDFTEIDLLAENKTFREEQVAKHNEASRRSHAKSRALKAAERARQAGQ